MNFKSAIGERFGTNFWSVEAIRLASLAHRTPPPPQFRDYSYTPEITLTLLNYFRINFEKLHLHIHF